MTDPENIPQTDPQFIAPSADPATFATPDPSTAPAPNAHEYPPSFLASELPPSPEQTAAQLRLSRIPPDLRVPWGWADLGIFLLFYLGSTVILLIFAMIATAGILHIPFQSLQNIPRFLSKSRSSGRPPAPSPRYFIFGFSRACDELEKCGPRLAGIH